MNDLKTITKVEKLLETITPESPKDQYLLVSAKLLISKLALNLIQEYYQKLNRPQSDQKREPTS